VLTTGSYSGTVTILPNYGSALTIDVDVEIEAGSFEVLFTNEVFTDIHINVTGQDARTIPVDGSTTYYFSTNPGTLSFYAETAGRTREGNLIGLNFEWDYSYNVSGLETFERNLIIKGDYFFIYFQNNGIHDLHEFYVNYGNIVHQTYDNIYLPADGKLYTIGYYRALSQTEIRAYWYNTSTYENWIQGQDFTLPFTDNQSALIENTSKNIPSGRTDDSPPLASTPKLIPVTQLPVKNLMLRKENMIPGSVKEMMIEVAGEAENVVEVENTAGFKPIPGFSSSSGPRQTVKRMEVPPDMKRPDLRVLLKNRKLKK
jgi:hypothetical protein